MNEFVKSDSGKPQYDLIPPEFLEGTAVILTHGAQKYEPRNWEMGAEWSRYFSALMRHMWAWWGGENADPETGKPHLWHASCCLAFLIAYEARGIGADDRPINQPKDNQPQERKSTCKPLKPLWS